MSPVKVMFVDDDEGMRISWNRYLASIGLDVTTAETAETGIAQLERERVDVVVSDLRMPGMDGLDFLRIVKERWPQIQVILLTGYGNPEVEGAVHDLGGFGYFSKPINPETMADTIQEAFEKIRDIPKLESEVEELLHKTDIPTKHALREDIEGGGWTGVGSNDRAGIRGVSAAHRSCGDHLQRRRDHSVPCHFYEVAQPLRARGP